jgi:hypothetical protein
LVAWTPKGFIASPDFDASFISAPRTGLHIGLAYPNEFNFEALKRRPDVRLDGPPQTFTTTKMRDND